MILDIFPWVGLGPLRFGMKPSEVQRAFGEEHAYQDWMGGNLNDSLLYRGLILGFDRHDSPGPLPDSRFVSVVAKGREDIWLFGDRLASWSRNDLVAFLEDRNWPRQEELQETLDIVDLAVGLSFDAGGQVDSVHFHEPRIHIIGVRRVRLPLSGFKVTFRGWPLRKEHRCLRTATRWEYMGVLGRPSGHGPYTGTLKPLDDGDRLRAGDWLVPVGDAPQVPTSTSYHGGPAD